MLSRGNAKKVTIYLNQDTRHHVEALWTTVFNFLRQKHVAGASVSRMMMGFGVHEKIHDAASEYVGAELPIRIEFIETADRVDELLPSLYEMVTDGLIEVQETTIVKSVRKDRPASALDPTLLRKPDARPATLIQIYLGESDRFGDEPLYEAIVKKLRMLDFAGATVNRGIMGYGIKRHTHKAGPLHLSRDMPIVITVIEKLERVDELVLLVSEMLQDGLITISDIYQHRMLAQIQAGEEPKIDGR
jgi:PII-like signaling protein